jgi:hypothetical protein
MCKKRRRKKTGNIFLYDNQQNIKLAANQANCIARGFSFNVSNIAKYTRIYDSSS